MSKPQPYRERVGLHEQGGEEVEAVVPVSIWPTGRRTNDKGEYYDYQGEAPLRFSNDLRAPNRYLLLGSDKYVIVEATPQTIVPHVALRLRRHNG